MNKNAESTKNYTKKLQNFYIRFLPRGLKFIGWHNRMQTSIFVYLIHHVLSFGKMTRKINLNSYKKQISDLKRKGIEWGLTNDEINFAFEESFLYLRNKYPSFYLQRPCTWFNCYFFKLTAVLLFIILGAYGLSYHKPTQNFVERNIQEAIYPFMKLYRRMTLPIVISYPSLTGLYDESCLLENPYFQVSKMDCWPCENIKFVLNLTDSKQSNTHIGLPYIIKVKNNLITFSDIKEIFNKHNEVFVKHSEKIQSNNGWTSITDLFSNDWSKFHDLHVAWRINRMEPARILRHILGFPKNVPNYATSILIERYLLFDGPSALPYRIPATEGANVFIKQLSGQRLIVLEPTVECLHSCQRLSVLLLEQHILWYNWWYWRPRSLPAVNNTEESLALLGSTV